MTRLTFEEKKDIQRLQIFDNNDVSNLISVWSDIIAISFLFITCFYKNILTY